MFGGSLMGRYDGHHLGQTRHRGGSRPRKDLVAGDEDSERRKDE